MARGRKKIFRDEIKYRMSPYGVNSWQIEEYKCLSAKKNDWKWTGILWPGNLEQSVDSMIHLLFQGELNFKLNLFPASEGVPRIDVNVSESDIRAITDKLEAIRTELTENIAEYVHVN